MQITDETIVRYSFHPMSARGDGQDNSPTRDVAFGVLSLGWSLVSKRGAAGLLEDGGIANYFNQAGEYRIATIEQIAPDPKVPPPVKVGQIWCTDIGTLRQIEEIRDGGKSCLLRSLHDARHSYWVDCAYVQRECTLQQPEAPRFTVEGSHLLRDGISVLQPVGTWTDCPLLQRVADLLNQQGEG